MELFHVSPAFIDQAWADGAHQLSKATARATREVTPDQLKMILARGERLLVGVREEHGPPLGWAVLSINQLPNIRVLYVWEIWSPGATGPAAFKLLANYARANGCSVIRGACDPAIARLWSMKLGAKPIYQIMEIDLA